MAIIEKYMQKCVLGNTDLVIKADTGESILVKDIRIENPVTDYISIHIEKILAGFFRVGGILGSHLPMARAVGSHSHGVDLASPIPLGTPKRSDLINAGGTVLNAGLLVDTASTAAAHAKAVALETPAAPAMTLLGLMREKGIFNGFPLAEGESLKISGAKQDGAIQLVEYEIHEAGDITAEMQNGTESKEYIFVNYGNAGATINASGDVLISTPKSPAQFPNFPFGKTVDPQKTITMYGVLGSDFAAAGNSGTNWIHTNFLKMTSGRKTLFDQDMNGLLFHAPYTISLGNLAMVGEGFSVMGNYSDVDRKMPLFFPDPLIFRSGEELNVFITLARGGGGQNITVDQLEIGFILKVAAGGE